MMIKDSIGIGQKDSLFKQKIEIEEDEEFILIKKTKPQPPQKLDLNSFEQYAF